MNRRLGNRGRGSRRTTTIALLAGVALAGCGSDDSSGSTDAPSTSSSTATASTTDPQVIPASGRKVDLEAFTARTPKGFDYDNSLAKEIVFSASRDYATEVTYSDITVYPGTSNRFAARLSVKNSDWDPQPAVADPVSFAGVTWYHLMGPIGKGQHLEEFGSVQSSRLVKLSFEMTGTSAQRKRLVASVLATVRLK